MVTSIIRAQSSTLSMARHLKIILCSLGAFSQQSFASKVTTDSQDC